MAIFIEQNNQWVEVSKERLFELARTGKISRQTKVKYDEKVGFAGQINALVFADAHVSDSTSQANTSQVNKPNEHNIAGDNNTGDTVPNSGPGAMWYYSQNNQQKGPIRFEALRSMVQSGVVSRATLVWKDGMPVWTPAGQTPEISALFGSTPPPMANKPSGPPQGKFPTAVSPSSQQGMPLPANAPGYHNAAYPRTSMPDPELQKKINEIPLYIIGNIFVLGPIGIILSVLIASAKSSGDYEKAKKYANFNKIFLYTFLCVWLLFFLVLIISSFSVS